VSRRRLALIEALKGRLVAIVRAWYWAFGLAPWLTLALFLAYLLRARIALGYWPEPYHPDPKELGFVVHRWAVFIAWVWEFAAALFVVLSVLVLRRLREEHLSPIRLYLVFGVGLALSWVANARLAGYWEWFFD
jgi:hypothetical protein